MASLRNIVVLLKRVLTVDKRMVPCKCLFFLTGCHLGSYQPYLNIFFVSVGLTKEQSGMLSGLMFVLPIIASPIWGLIVDFTGRRKIVLFALVYCGTFLFCALPWIAHGLNPLVERPGRQNITNSTNKSSVSPDTRNKDGFGEGYIILVIMVLFTSIFVMPLPILTDTMGMIVVKSSRNGSVYGVQSCFWMLGGISGVSLAGITSSHFKDTFPSPYTGIFIVFIASTILIYPIGCILIGQASCHVTTQKTVICQDNEDAIVSETGANNDSHLMVGKVNYTTEQLTWKNIIAFHLRIEILIFLTTVFLTGCSHFLFHSTSYIYMDEKMDVSTIQMIFVTNIAITSQFIFSMFSSKMISSLGGPIRAIGLGILTTSIRYFIISFDISYQLFLCVQMSTGLTMSLPWNSLMEHCINISPKTMYATTNSVMLSVFRFIANVVTNVVGLKVYALVGGRKLYLIFSMISFGWFLLILAYYEGRNLLAYCQQRGVQLEVEGEIADRNKELLV